MGVLEKWLGIWGGQKLENIAMASEAEFDEFRRL